MRGQGDFRNIWVFMERRGGQVHPVSFELLSKGNRLKRSLGEDLAAVFFGEVSARERAECAAFGADEILSISIGPEYGRSCEVMAEVLSQAVHDRKPSIFLAGATALGRSLMPLVAVRLRTGLTADCTDLAIDEERGLLLQTRPAFGGNILATIVCPDSKPQMATVRPHVFKMERAADPGDQKIGDQEISDLGIARILNLSYEPGPLRAAEILETVLEGEETDITESDVIVAGGRGLGKPEGFELLGRLAQRLGGAVGASRGAVDLGWISAAHQVGQTGHTVNPKLYLACGVSGAIQHIAGMKGAEVIVAINQDPDAPIFQLADYGIIGDLYEVIPRILEALEGANSAKCK